MNLNIFEIFKNDKGDAIEILCVSFVLPSAQCDLHMTSADKGFLSSMTFAGKKQS